MAEVKNIKKIPSTLTVGKEVYELYCSLKSMKGAKEVQNKLKTIKKRFVLKLIILKRQSCIVYSS